MSIVYPDSASLVLNHMTRISAADNWIIEFETNRWRLLSNSNEQERLVVEAVNGQTLRYGAFFANKRRLPQQELDPESIQQVTVGWSETDESWHLGFILAPELAATRGSRWCELAYWPDASAQAHAEQAEQAGEALGQATGRPFKVIPPRPRPEEAEKVAELPALPLNCGIWTLQREAKNLVFKRSSAWIRSRLVRMAWYGFWLAIFVVLSVATLTTDLALPNSGLMLPNPELLPYLGLVAGAVLLLLILGIVYQIFTKPNRIIIEPDTRRIEAYRGTNPRWQWQADELSSVYVTQVVAQRGKKRTMQHGELNLYRADNDFAFVLALEQEEERLENNRDRPAEYVQPIGPEEVDTDLQAAGLYIAQSLGGLPCIYDQRVS